MNTDNVTLSLSKGEKAGGFDRENQNHFSPQRRKDRKETLNLSKKKILLFLQKQRFNSLFLFSIPAILPNFSLGFLCDLCAFAVNEGFYFLCHHSKIPRKRKPVKPLVFFWNRAETTL